MAKRWYIINAYSGLEHQVARSLKERIERSDIADQFGKILVPTETVVGLRKGNNRTTSERKMYPGYVFVQMEMNDDAWHLVKEVPKVMGFIGGVPGKPAPVSDGEMERILQHVEEGKSKPKPKIMFKIGEVVRVTEGPFSDYEGQVTDVNYEKSKVRVAVSILGRSTPVELSFGQVEKL